MTEGKVEAADQLLRSPVQQHVLHCFILKKKKKVTVTNLSVDKNSMEVAPVVIHLPYI